MNCHILDNGMPWMRIGPVLTAIGSKPLREFQWGKSHIPHTREAYIRNKLRNPKIFETPENPKKMPRFSLTEQDIQDLTVFLLSLKSSSAQLQLARGH